MKLRRKQLLLLLLLAAWAAAGLLPGCSHEAPPNFVWIISEDNSKHYMALFDDHGIATPHISSMAEAGILFQRAFSNAPVCSVARSTLISSCYAPRIGAQYHRKMKLVQMPEGTDMFPAYLRRAGYYTTNCSKEDYNLIKRGDVWDESSKQAHWKNRSPGQPFFHKASYGVSHESSLHFPAELVERYEPVTDPDSVYLFPQHPDTELFRFTAAYYRDRILAVDSIVGRVLQELEDAGELESTFVFYFGDHGGVLPGSKGYTWESGLHVPLVVRVPEKFRHLVDFPRGSETDGFVSFVDLGPTLLELAGAGIPDGIDGKPFLGPGISAGEVAHWNGSYGYADRFDEKYDMVRTLRKGDFKYIRNYQPFNFDGLQNNYRYKCLAFTQWRELYRKGKLNEVQGAFFEARAPEALYDLASDPHETRNLAGDPAYREKLEELRGQLGSWVRGMPDLSFYPESRLVTGAFSGDPAAFGQDHQQEIARLADVADLALLPFEEARGGILEAMQSEDPLRIYWALIACSSFGAEAGDFADEARGFCQHQDLLVRTRAAEFLALSGQGDPVPVIRKALEECQDPVEALLILNTLVMLQDGPGNYDFRVEGLELADGLIHHPEVGRRLEYIVP
jgi:arylsulfatase A-like enzyme